MEGFKINLGSADGPDEERMKELASTALLDAKKPLSKKIIEDFSPDEQKKIDNLVLNAEGMSWKWLNFVEDEDAATQIADKMRKLVNMDNPTDEENKSKIRATVKEIVALLENSS